jgi:uncharacterized tellurite resistance protein B-like protein
MERYDLQKLLLETAVCTIACDGEIHQLELAELNSMVSEAVYFRDLNGKPLLDKMLEEVNKNGRDFFHKYLESLKASELTSVQELLVLEIVLRIIYADKRFDENEAIFLRLVRSQLNLHDEIIVQRFGATPYIAKAESIDFSSRDSLPILDTLSEKMDNIRLNADFNIEIPDKGFAEITDIES